MARELTATMRYVPIETVKVTELLFEPIATAYRRIGS
jgi:hypothetical protein